MIIHHVVSATTNPAKIQAILQAFDEIFGEDPATLSPSPSRAACRNSPSAARKRAGARNRVANARLAQPNADFWVAIEAGIDDDSTFSWVVIESASQREKRAQPRCRCLTLFLSRFALAETRPVMSQYTGIDQIGRKEGAIGVFTGGRLTRSSVYHQAVVLALSPFHNAIYR